LDGAIRPRRLDIAHEFERGFDGMTDSPVTLDDLIQAREHLIAEVVGKMPKKKWASVISINHD
jgi:hypothetical protein